MTDTAKELLAHLDGPMTPIERVRCALAMSDAGYKFDPSIEDIIELLDAYDRLSARQQASVEEVARFITPDPDRCVFGSGSVGYDADGKPHADFKCSLYAWQQNTDRARALLAKYDIFKKVEK